VKPSDYYFGIPSPSQLKEARRDNVIAIVFTLIMVALNVLAYFFG